MNETAQKKKTIFGIATYQESAAENNNARRAICPKHHLHRETNFVVVISRYHQ
jgi:hypothetical protein